MNKQRYYCLLLMIFQFENYSVLRSPGFVGRKTCVYLLLAAIVQAVGNFNFAV
jgi:hypothetical protein